MHHQSDISLPILTSLCPHHFLWWFGYRADRGTLGIAVLDNFTGSVSVNLISNCGFVVFKQTWGMQFFYPAFWMLLKIILQVF